METTVKPRTVAELLPGLSGIMSKDAMQTLTARKQPRKTIAHTRTGEKAIVRPLTIAEMRADIQALKMQSPKRLAQGANSVKKKNWNSSVKVDKTKSHTADGQMKNNPVRKVLNFHPKPKVQAVTNPRMTMATETPKFPKPDFRAKKSVHLQARNNIRISGICRMSETPVVTKISTINRMTLANKENISNQTVVSKKLHDTPKTVTRKRLLALRVPDTPLSNVSWKSSCDASFLEKEKEIQFIEDKTKALTEEKTLENIAEVSPPVSTPFKEYRNVKEYFNNTSEMDQNDDTIMCFDKPSLYKDNSKREESVIVSLCDMLNKATVNNCKETNNTELDDLLEVEKQTENNIKLIDNGIQMLNNIRESQLKSLEYVKKLLIEKKKGGTVSENGHDKTLVEEAKDTPKVVKVNLSPVISKPCSVIKSCSKSPTYKIPKKNACLRKKMFFKSMPNVSNGMQTPNKDMGEKALSMYMKMKEHMNFLNTPVVKHRTLEVPDTPAVTSHNLQIQLDKLYGEN